MLKFASRLTAYDSSLTCSSGCSTDSQQPESSAHSGRRNRRGAPLFITTVAPGSLSEIAERAPEIDLRNCAARNGHRRRHRNERKKRRFAGEGVSRFVAKIIVADAAERRSWN